MKTIYDVIIVGGGPAGLSAALVLGRSMRSVLVCDNGKPRNLKAENMHGFISRDGFKPLEFLRTAREELKKYNVTMCKIDIIKARKLKNGFEIEARDGKVFSGKRLLLATGVEDELPEIPGLYDMYGKSVFHCPYCDGWESRDKKIGVIAKGLAAAHLSYSLKTWSKDVVIISNGKSRIPEEEIDVLKKSRIKVIEKKIKELKGRNGFLQRLIFEDDSELDMDVIFFSGKQRQKSDLAEQLGVEMNKGLILFDKKQHTNIEGVFAAGDNCKDVKFVIVAAAEGAKAAIAINISFQGEIKRKLKKLIF